MSMILLEEPVPLMDGWVLRTKKVDERGCTGQKKKEQHQGFQRGPPP